MKPGYGRTTNSVALRSDGRLQRGLLGNSLLRGRGLGGGGGRAGADGVAVLEVSLLGGLSDRDGLLALVAEGDLLLTFTLPLAVTGAARAVPAVAAKSKAPTNIITIAVLRISSFHAGSRHRFSYSG